MLEPRSLWEQNHEKIRQVITALYTRVNTLSNDNEFGPLIDAELELDIDKNINGRTLKEVYLDDLLLTFDAIMYDVPANKAPLKLYAEMLQERRKETIDEADAQRIFQDRKEGIPQSVPAYPVWLDFLQNVKISEDTCQELETAWSAVIQNFSFLLQTESFLAANLSTIELKNEFLSSVAKRKEIFSQYYESKAQETQAEKAAGSGQTHAGSAISRRSSGSKSDHVVSSMSTSDDKKGTQNQEDILSPAEILLNGYSKDLTKVTAGDHCVVFPGRTHVIEKIFTTLLQSENNNVIFSHKEGIDYKELPKEIARLIEKGAVPARFKEGQLLTLDLQGLFDTFSLSTKSFQDTRSSEKSVRNLFDQKMHMIFEQISKHNENGEKHIICHIPDFGHFLNLRAPQSITAVSSLISCLKQYPNLSLLCSIPEHELDSLKASEPALFKYFTDIELPEPNTADLRQLLSEDMIFYLGLQNNVQITDEVVSYAITQSDKHIRDQKQPGKVLTLLQKSLAKAEFSGDEHLKKDHIDRTIAELTDVPLTFISSGMGKNVLKLESSLKGHIFGQDTAIESVVSCVRRASAGLRDPNSPMGSFIFKGPTGVGKTELAKALACYLFDTEKALIRINMSDYMEKHTVSRLIGAPPGYVGFDEKSPFEDVRKRPYSVLLLDEIEKAHPDVFNVLLSILDEGEGRLRNKGSLTLDFRNCIIIGTSNIGQREAAGLNAIGFTGSAEERQKVAEEKALRDKFAAEFLNRVTPVNFDHLDEKSIRRIAGAQVEKVSKWLNQAHPNLRLTVTDHALDQLMEDGYSKEFGARHMRREVIKQIDDPVANWVLSHGRNIRKPTELIVSDLNDFRIETQKLNRAPV